MRGYPDDWPDRRKKVFSRDRWACQRCGRQGGPRGSAQLHAHHEIPKSEGGSHAVSNLTTFCDRCHAIEHDDPRLVEHSGGNGSSTTLRGHIVVFLFTFWTFGLGNLIYVLLSGASHRTGNGEYSLRRGRESLYEERDQEYNEVFDGCSACGKDGLRIDWCSDGRRKRKVIECKFCDAIFREKSGPIDDLEQVQDTSEISTTASALAQEIEKHIDRGNVDASNITEMKKEVIRRADTRQEKRHAKRVFSKYERKLTR